MNLLTKVSGIRSYPILITFVFALGGNAVWEMAQMHAYSSLPSNPSEMVLWCGAAAVVDAIYASGLYLFGQKLTHEQNWTSRRLLPRLLLAAIATLFAALVIEMVFQNIGSWRYSESMPIIPGIHVGLLPVLQLPLLTVAVLVIVGRIANSK